MNHKMPAVWFRMKHSATDSMNTYFTFMSEAHEFSCQRETGGVFNWHCNMTFNIKVWFYHSRSSYNRKAMRTNIIMHTLYIWMALFFLAFLFSSMNKIYNFEKEFSLCWEIDKAIPLVFMNSILKANAIILKSHWSPEFYLCKRLLLVKMEIEL